MTLKSKLWIPAVQNPAFGKTKGLCSVFLKIEFWLSNTCLINYPWPLLQTSTSSNFILQCQKDVFLTVFKDSLIKGGGAPCICDKSGCTYATVILSFPRNLPKIALGAHKIRSFSVNPFGARVILNFPNVNIHNCSFLQNCLSFSKIVFVIRNNPKTINISPFSSQSKHKRKT